MREEINRLLPMRSEFVRPERALIDQIPRWRSDARFLAMLISSHLNFNFMRKNRRNEPNKGTSAYSITASRSQPSKHHVVDILA
jgi:hypothetical protein